MQRKCAGAKPVAPVGPADDLVMSSVPRCQASTVQPPSHAPASPARPELVGSPDSPSVSECVPPIAGQGHSCGRFRPGTAAMETACAECQRAQTGGSWRLCIAMLYQASRIEASQQISHWRPPASSSPPKGRRPRMDPSPSWDRFPSPESRTPLRFTSRQIRPLTEPASSAKL